MRIIFSRDRAAQLDLLAQSLDRYASPERTEVIWTATTPEFREGYRKSGVAFAYNETKVGGFGDRLRYFLHESPDTNVTFFCDDNVLYRPLPVMPLLKPEHEHMLTFSLRLGRDNTQMPLPDGFPVWNWTELERHDFGFPCSIDGHTFRVEDVISLIGRDRIDNPTALETVMALRVSLFEQRRPLMGSFALQCLVGVPVNRVSETSGVPHGEVYPQSTQMLNERFLGGERIDLDALDFSGIDGCHKEIEFMWRPR